MVAGPATRPQPHTPSDHGPTTVIDPDPALVEAFAGRVMTDFAAAASTAMTVVGDRLGLYEALVGAGALTADDLATRTGLNRRLVAEWAAGQAVAGYLSYQPAGPTYELPIEHALVLAAASPAYVVGAGEIVAGQYATLTELESAFRGDGGVDYSRYPHTLKHGIERFFGTAYRHQLADVWFPAVPGLVDKLADGARVADVGCGHGAATLLMAGRWPRSTYRGFDLDEDSIAVARNRAVEAGQPVDIYFQVAQATSFGPGPFDVVTFFDALHDLGDPAAALRHAHDLLAPGGILVAVEPWSTDRLEDSIGNPVARIGYAVSASLCTPTSLAQPGSFGLGNGGGPARRLDLLAEAGFSDAHVAADTGQNLIITARVAG